MEFVDFKERLLHSHTRLLGVAEAVAVSLRAAAVASSAALADAAAAAAAKLAADPLAELVVVQPERQTDAEASCEVAALIRFDEDLSTRPCWFPPHTGAARTAVACWWEAALAAADSSSPAPQCGFAACWWSEVAAAESRGAAAAAWRACQLAALQRRWLTPAVLAAALAKQPGAEQLALLQQCSEQWSAAAEAASNGTASTVIATLDGLLAALTAAALAMQAALSALEDSDRAPAVAAASSTAVEALSTLQHRWDAACELLAATLVPASGQLVGLPLPASHGPALAGPLLAEEAPFAAACLQAWAGRLAAAGKHNDAAASELLASVRAAAGSLQAGMEAVALALEKLLERSQAEQVKTTAAALNLFGGVSGAPGQQQQWPPWAFERGLKSVEVVKRLVGEQRETAARLAAAARAVEKTAAGMAAA